MNAKEATARIKINRLLEEAGWRFFDDENGICNVRLESNTKIATQVLDGKSENSKTISPPLSSIGKKKKNSAESLRTPKL